MFDTKKVEEMPERFGVVGKKNREKQSVDETISKGNFYQIE
jgi:hypothetical protein